jgi:hypothetical protein
MKFESFTVDNGSKEKFKELLKKRVVQLDRAWSISNRVGSKRVSPEEEYKTINMIVKDIKSLISFYKGKNIEGLELTNTEDNKKAIHYILKNIADARRERTLSNRLIQMKKVIYENLKRLITSLNDYLDNGIIDNSSTSGMTSDSSETTIDIDTDI